jgi:selenocysteine lyase/cysteine desulfurase
MTTVHVAASATDQSHTFEDAQEAYRAFALAHPEYDKTGKLDELREREYSRLRKLDHVYLDYTGGSLYSDYQLAEHIELLKNRVYGNPHSHNPSSLASTDLDEHAREFVLEYFNGSPEEYVVIFTSNASGALKLIGESYPFGPSSRYVLTFDNHNAANGIREFARAKGACITYAPVVAPELRIDDAQLMQHLREPDAKGHNLFVYPAQSNFSGVQHSFEWIERAHAYGWDVILDAAAFVPTNVLDLSVHKPDFIALSFYKMFGYPTGVGCLIARKTALRKLRRPWFSGGTIEVASVQADKYYLAQGSSAFEDGTINYLNLPAVEIGLRFLRNVGVDVIHERVKILVGWLLENLSRLHHANGANVVEIYGPRNTVSRGGTIALNFHDSSGNVFNFHQIEDAASKLNISLRTGCFCNPGAGEIAFGLTKNDMSECFDNDERSSFEQCLVAVKGKTAGAVRVSLGIVSNFSDVYRFLEFARTFVDKRSVQMRV